VIVPSTIDSPIWGMMTFVAMIVSAFLICKPQESGI
jgi:hypothetical protein